MGDGTDGDRRVEFLDALRGVAILGILPVNAAYFAFTTGLHGRTDFPPRSGPLDAFAAHAVRLLFEYKFITIFNVLFGAGIVLLRSHAIERGEPWKWLVARRLLVLGLLGVLHAVLLWFGDIVAWYALFGLALFWTAGWTPRSLRIAAVVGLALSLLPLLAGLVVVAAGNDWVTALVTSMERGELPDGRHSGWEPGSWSGFAGQIAKFDPDFEIAVYRGDSFGQMLVLRAATWAAASLEVVPLFGPRIAGLFLLGMAWAREGWLLAPGSEEGRRRFGLLFRRGLAFGVPLSVAAAALRVALPDDARAIVGAEALHYVGSLGLAAAYAALVARLCASRAGTSSVRALAAVGRTAFTNYLLQSAVMTTIFYGTTVFFGAGLGWFGSVRRAPLLGIAALLAAAQVGASVLWLRRFRMGPVEWLWRAATYMQRPPMRRGRENSS